MGATTKLTMRSVALALLATLVVASLQSMAAGEQYLTIPDSDMSFDEWLQYMAATSDNDDDVTATVESSPDADAATGTWAGGVSELTSSQDKDGSLTKMPKVNRDSIGVLPKPTGKATKVVVAKNGKGDYTTITDALKDIPPHATHRTIIHIKAGVYK